MENKICIATGWYSSGEPTNEKSSPLMYEQDWLDTWREFHKVDKYAASTVYESKCDEVLSVETTDKFSLKSWAIDPTDKYHTRRDWWNSMLLGAVYAYANDLHLVYIEQDCLVQNLDGAIKYAIEKDAKIAYGFGKYSYGDGWAENALTFVSNEFLHHFVGEIMRLESDKEIRPILEIIFHEMFKDYATYWPFGYGRFEVENWNDSIFYKQQLTDEEVKKFMELKNV